MDDYHTDSLIESRNEWMSRFVNILTPLLNEGVQSIFTESFSLCKENNETEKYLMTFQNFLSRVPSWNQTIVENECMRLVDKSKCNYLNDLLTCVHVIQLKMLTNVRVCKTQKQVSIDIPKLENYVHRVYIAIARKLYKCVYLFERDCTPLQKQKHNREVETIIRECIVNTIRDTIPIEKLLSAYMGDEMVEEIEREEVKSEPVNESEDIGKTTTTSESKETKTEKPVESVATSTKEPESKKDLTSSETSKTELEKPKVELPPVLPAEVNPPKKDESDFQTSSSSNVTMDIRTTPEPTAQEKVDPIDTTNLINASGNLSPPLPPTRASTDAPKSVLDNANVSFDLNKNTVTNIERTNNSGFTNYDDDDEVVKITGDDVDIMDDVEELDF